MEQVAEGTLQLSLEEGENLVKDRTFLCTFASPYYEFCETGTSIPKWCANNPTAIFCPDDLGYEYDPVTGGGGSSGGGGAGRTWTAPLCFDGSGNIISCSVNTIKRTYLYTYDIRTGVEMTKQERLDDTIEPITGYRRGYNKPMQGNVACVDQNDRAINCDLLNYDGTVPLPIPSGWQVYSDGCWTNWDNSGYKVPCAFHIKVNPNPDTVPKFSLGGDMAITDFGTGLPISDGNFTNGFPTPYVAPPPALPGEFDTGIPEGTAECGAICTWLSYIFNALKIVNASVLKVDVSIREMVDNMTAPLPVDNSALMAKLDEILTAIDNVSFELVKEAETNFWDVLGGAFGDIFDLIEFLIEKVIYLLIPEDTTSIRESFDLLTQDLKDKIKPIHDLQTNITAAVTVEDKQFESIEINLPVYGPVPFYKVDYLLIAIPYIRMLLGAMMIMMTSIWAYKKVSSELIK